MILPVACAVLCLAFYFSVEKFVGISVPVSEKPKQFRTTEGESLISPLMSLQKATWRANFFFSSPLLQISLPSWTKQTKQARNSFMKEIISLW